MPDKVRLVQYGCGVIGLSIAKLASEKPNLSIVGAIDIANAGTDLGNLIGLSDKLGVIIADDADAILSETRPNIVLHATSSSLKDIYPQLEKAVRAGANVVSTCEELSYPWKNQLDLASVIDKLAKNHRVTVLGTGVNPGFLMDTWPLVMTAVCQRVEEIRVARVQDASLRRLPFQQKIGAGKTIEEFNRLVQAGTLRHVGLGESIAMIAAGLEWELDDITETIEPVIATNEAKSNLLTVKAGQAAGVKQVGYGWKDGKKVITLDFQAYIGAQEPCDAVYITGIPSVEVVIRGGINGDIATAAMVINSIKRVIDAPPGLITMKDLPVVTGWL